MKKIIVLAIALTLAGCFGPSDEQKKRAMIACEKFVLDKLGGYLSEAHTFDIYAKRDKIVVEVGYKAWANDDSYSVRFCIYDEEKRTISLPSVLNMGQWNK